MRQTRSTSFCVLMDNCVSRRQPALSGKPTSLHDHLKPDSLLPASYRLLKPPFTRQNSYGTLGCSDLAKSNHEFPGHSLHSTRGFRVPSQDHIGPRDLIVQSQNHSFFSKERHLQSLSLSFPIVTATDRTLWRVFSR